MFFIAAREQTQGGKETCREQERQERPGPRCEQGCTAEHHPAQYEHQKDLVQNTGVWIEEKPCRPPAGSGHPGADGEGTTPSADRNATRRDAPKTADQDEPAD